MAKTVVGLFDDFSEAQMTAQDLINSGFRREHISVVANQDAVGRERMVGHEAADSSAAEGAGAGAVGGTVLGGALGFLVGAGLLAIPGIGPVLAAGPLAAAIGTTAATVGATALGAGIGAATGGLIGGLIGSGVPREDAEYYAEGVRRGGTLVSVSTDDTMAELAHDIMRRHAVVDIDERASEWRSAGWAGYDDSTEPLGRASTTAGTMGADTMTTDRMVHSDDIRGDTGTLADAQATPLHNRYDTLTETDEVNFNSHADHHRGTGNADIDMQQAGMASTTAMGSGAMGSGAMSGGMNGFDDYDNDYRSHYQTAYGSAGYTYDDYAPVYRYGHSLASDSRYSGREWSDIEMDARRRWEERNPGTWEQFKETVRFAWDKARGKR